jgi:uncharacterized membrane protein
MTNHQKYNPSSWGQRNCVAFLALIATALALYMGLYQWKLISHVWDPVFKDGTMKVLDSDVSHKITDWIRLPDAIFGALAYLSDIIFTWAGSTNRWKDRPWLVFIFGLDIIPIGCVSLILVALQGLAVGHWCFPCIVSAVISLILVFLAYGEVAASIRYVLEIWKRTKSITTAWYAFCGYPCEVSNEAAEAVLQRITKNVG